MTNKLMISCPNALDDAEPNTLAEIEIGAAQSSLTVKSVNRNRPYAQVHCSIFIFSEQQTNKSGLL